MTPSTYHLAFDLSGGYEFWRRNLPPVLVPLAIGIAVAIIPTSTLDRFLTRSPKGGAGIALIVAFALFDSAIMAGAAFEHYSQKRYFTTLAAEGKLHFTEGCLQGFHPMDHDGHEDEVVRLNGKEFTYSDFDQSSPAFNKTESYGGPIHKDSSVRIWHKDNNIIKLEVSDHACPQAPDLPPMG